MWAPRTRGWSSHAPSPAGASRVGPAHAGVVPSIRSHSSRICRGPRARGGGPVSARIAAPATRWAPRTRGWSLYHTSGYESSRVGPAHAGVVRAPLSLIAYGFRGPRARGGGPDNHTADRMVMESAPRTRGWSRSMGCRKSRCWSGPRGDGPLPTGRGPSSGESAPRRWQRGSARSMVVFEDGRGRCSGEDGLGVGGEAEAVPVEDGVVGEDVAQASVQGAVP